MKTAYVTTYDSKSVKNWSGTGYHIAKTLEVAIGPLDYINNLSPKRFIVNGIKRKIYRLVLGKSFMEDRTKKVGDFLAMQVITEVEDKRIDLIFSPGTIPIAYLNTHKPVVFWTDATFAAMIDFYPEFSNLCKETIRNGNEMEQAALSGCTLAIYSSEWAARSAIENYDVDSNKVKVVPFGANINCTRTVTDIKQVIEQKDFQVCKLLFIGVDWERKGGDKALRTAEILNKQGIPTELHIVGCYPPVDIPNFVVLHGFISKDTNYGREYLDRLFSSSTFLILPSKAECYGVVFAEASSFGLPSLTSMIGGIPTVVSNGINGRLFNVNDSPEVYAYYVASMMNSRENYQNLSFSSFTQYAEKLDWSIAGKNVAKLIHKYCSN